MTRPLEISFKMSEATEGFRVDGDRIWLPNGFYIPADPATRKWQIDIMRFVYLGILGALTCEQLPCYAFVSPEFR